MRIIAASLLLTISMSLGAQASRAPGDASQRIRLRVDTTISGVRCGPTGRAYAVIHPNGRLDECPLAGDTTVAGHSLPRGTWIRLTTEGSLRSVWLAKPLALQGVPCRGEGYKGWAVDFHPSGALALCYLDRAAVIDGVPCAAASFLTELSGNSAVALREDRRLRSCRLSRDHDSDGVRHRKGTRITVP